MTATTPDDSSGGEKRTPHVTRNAPIDDTSPILFPGFRGEGSGVGVQGVGFRVWGVGFRVQGSGFMLKVESSRFRV